MAGTFSRSFTLVGQCFKVLKKDKELVLFPILSGLFMIPVYTLLFLPILLTVINKQTNFLFGPNGWSGYALLLLFLFYFLSFLVVIFFNTALIGCAQIRLMGDDPSFMDGIKIAFKNFGKIVVWALVSATVGVILKVIMERSSWIGKILAAIFGMAWSLLTFFVIPVMIFENKGVFSSIKESGKLFTKTWGENFVGSATIGLVFFIVGILVFILLIIIGAVIMQNSGFALAYVVVAGVLLLYIVASSILSSSLNGIFVSALYTYARTGKITEPFSYDTVQMAFEKKSLRH